MPIDTPQRTSFGPHRVARVHVVTPREQVQPAMHAAIHELVSALQGQGISPAGPWFAHHHRKPTGTFDFDVCFPVDQPLQPSGRIEIGDIPGTDVLRTVYRGPYEGLPQAWPEFAAWINENGYVTREDAFEVYSIGPREDKNALNWQTELNYPLAASAAPAGR